MCLHVLPERPDQADNNNNTSSSSSSSNSSNTSNSSSNDVEHLSFDGSLSDHQRTDLIQDSSFPGLFMFKCSNGIQRHWRLDCREWSVFWLLFF